MQVVKVGDSIQGTQAKLTQVLTQVLTDKIVLKELLEKEDGSEKQEAVLLYKAKNGVSRIERLRREPPPSKPIKVNEVQSITPPKK